MENKKLNLVILLAVIYCVVAIVLGVGSTAAVVAALQGGGEIARGTTGYGWFNQEQVTLSGIGTAGAVTDSENTDGFIHGHIYAIHVDFESGVTTTTDLTISLASPALTVLQVSNTATDTWHYPAVQQTGSNGSAISGAYDRIPVSGQLLIEAGQSSSGTIGTVTVWWGQ